MEEISLYNINGNPVAYIANDKETIYLWEGMAIAYVAGDKLYGWNGKHLGWFEDGIFYDLNGLRVGFTKDKNPGPAYIEPSKAAKYARYAKYAKYAPNAKPVLSTQNSDINLRDLLKDGGI